MARNSAVRAVAAAVCLLIVLALGVSRPRDSTLWLAAMLRGLFTPPGEREENSGMRVRSLSGPGLVW
jgi:hypothetical protein